MILRRDTLRSARASMTLSRSRVRTASDADPLPYVRLTAQTQVKGVCVLKTLDGLLAYFAGCPQ